MKFEIILPHEELPCFVSEADEVWDEYPDDAMEFEEIFALLEDQGDSINVVLAFGDPSRIEDIGTRISIGEILQELEFDELYRQIRR